MSTLEDFIAKCEANGKSYDEINLKDAPELTEEDFATGHFKYWKPPQKVITMRIDLDNLDWLQSVGKKNYQARLNNALRWARLNNCPVTQL